MSRASRTAGDQLLALLGGLALATGMAGAFIELDPQTRGWGGALALAAGTVVFIAIAWRVVTPAIRRRSAGQKRHRRGQR